MSQKTAEEYANFLEDTSWYQHVGHRDAKEFAYLTLGLAGETGEMVDAFKKLVREIGFDASTEDFRGFMGEGSPGYTPYETMRDELGDVLWYLVRLCDVMNINLEALMLSNTYKLHTRILERGYFEECKWPFSDPFQSKDNVQMNMFPQDMPDEELEGYDVREH